MGQHIHLHILHGFSGQQTGRKEGRTKDKGQVAGAASASGSTDGDGSQDTGKKKNNLAADWTTEKDAVSGAKISGTYKKVLDGKKNSRPP